MPARAECVHCLPLFSDPIAIETQSTSPNHITTMERTYITESLWLVLYFHRKLCIPIVYDCATEHCERGPRDPMNEEGATHLLYHLGLGLDIFTSRLSLYPPDSILELSSLSRFCRASCIEAISPDALAPEEAT